jgi:hypothetical protein
MAQADATVLDPGIESTRPERLRTADGVPLRAALRRAERRRKIAAFLLVAPLLFFILTFFVFPIAQMMWRSVDNPQVVRALPLTLEALERWDGEGVPGEEVFAALRTDFLTDLERPRGVQACYRGYPVAWLIQLTANLDPRAGQANLYVLLILRPHCRSGHRSSGAHLRLEGAAAAAGRDQRHAGLDRARRR